MTRISSLSVSAFSILIALFISAQALIILPASAHAHTLAVEGEVGATLHIDPADEPVAGSPSTIYLDFKNSKREFDPSEYAFVLSIGQNGSPIASTTLFGNGETGATASYTYTFAQPGDYVIRIVGTPKDGDEPTTLTFDTHVSSAVPTQKNGLFAFLGVHGGHALIILLLIAILVIVVGYEKWKEYRIKRGD
ncbi:MAG: hypothetical protein JWN49_118 [Parcubacteria group bacterium]|nr:hypothetical protein [Parcubacteria group bacterium]